MQKIKKKIEQIGNIEDIFVISREDEIVLHRAWFFKIMYDEFNMSYRRIAELCNHKQSTVRHACVNFEGYLRDFPQFKKSYNKHNGSIINQIRIDWFLDYTLSPEEVENIKMENINLKKRLIPLEDINELTSSLSPAQLEDLLKNRIETFVKSLKYNKKETVEILPNYTNEPKLQLLR